MFTHHAATQEESYFVIKQNSSIFSENCKHLASLVSKETTSENIVIDLNLFSFYWFVNQFFYFSAILRFTLSIEPCNE